MLATWKLSTPMCLAAGLLAGCTWTESAKPAPQAAIVEPAIWMEEAEAAGTKIRLGHRSEENGAIEPLCLLVKDGKPVADAMVFIQLIAADKKPLSKEVAAVYATEGNAAVYSPGKFPAKADEELVVRFRIIFAGDQPEWTKDLEISAVD